MWRNWPCFFISWLYQLPPSVPYLSWSRHHCRVLVKNVMVKAESMKLRLQKLKFPQVSTLAQNFAQGKGESGISGYLRWPYGYPCKRSRDFWTLRNDLYCEIPIKFTLAALGGTIEVPTLQGKGSKYLLEHNLNGIPPKKYWYPRLTRWWQRWSDGSR